MTKRARVTFPAAGLLSPALCPSKRLESLRLRTATYDNRSVGGNTVAFAEHGRGIARKMSEFLIAILLCISKRLNLTVHIASGSNNYPAVRRH